MNTVTQIIVGAVLLAAAVFLVIAVLMQEGKSYRLSGAIAGGADTIFGKTKGKKISDTLSKITTIVAIVFVIIVVVLTIATKPKEKLPDFESTETEQQNNGGETTPDNGGETTPDNGGETTPANGGENTPDNGGENTPDNGGENTPDNGGENTPDNGGENTPDNGGENNAEG